MSNNHLGSAIPVFALASVVLATVSACTDTADGTGGDWHEVSTWHAELTYFTELDQTTESPTSSSERQSTRHVQALELTLGDRERIGDELIWTFAHGDGDVLWLECSETSIRRQWQLPPLPERRRETESLTKGSGPSPAEVSLHVNPAEGSYRVWFSAGPLETVQIDVTEYRDGQLHRQDQYPGLCETGVWAADGRLPATPDSLFGEQTWQETDEVYHTLTWSLRAASQ